MSNDFKSILQKHTHYIFRREALRMLGQTHPTNPLRPTFMYKTDQSFSSFIDRSNFPKLESFLYQTVLISLYTIDQHYKKESFRGLILEYDEKPLIIFENYEYDDSPMSLFLHVDLQELHSEICIMKEIKEYVVRSKKRIDMMMLGVCFFCISLLVVLHC